LNEQDYRKIISQLDYDILYSTDIVELRKVLESNPFVKAARVSRHFPNKVNIQIVERKPLGIINIDNQLMIDDEAVVLPGKKYSEDYLIPVLSGFNSAIELYPEGEKTYSIKVKEAVDILKKLSIHFADLYENISELTLNKDDEYVLILADRPTRVVLGKDNISLKFDILKSFDKALGQRQLTDFRLIDMRYNKQLVAREWT
jgi:cell division septal protein FtsQ